MRPATAPIATLLACGLLAIAATGTAAAPRAAHPPAWQLPGAGGFAFGFGSVWIAGGDEILRVDPRTNRVKATIRSANGGGWPIATANAIWILDDRGLDRIDPRMNRIVTRIHVPAGQGALAYGFGSFWIATRQGNLLRVDPRARAVTATIKVQGPANWSPIVAAGDGAVWIASADRHEVLRIDPKTDSITGTTPVTKDDSLLTVGIAYASVWVHANAAANGRGLVYRLDPATGRVMRTLTTSRASGGQYGGTNIAFGAGGVWTGNANGTVSKIAADGSSVLRAVTTSLLANFIAVGAGSLWVQSNDGPAVRIPLSKFAP